MRRSSSPMKRRGSAAPGRGKAAALHAQHAFTLIELMIAAGLVGLVLVAASSLVWQVTGARARVTRLTAHHAEADAALKEITSALRDTFRNVGEEAPLFEGLDEELDQRPADRLRFRSVSERVIRPGEPESDVHEVEFWLEAVPDEAWPSLLRRADPTRNELPDGGGVIERVARNIAAFDVSYFDGLGWVPDWPEVLGVYPEAIRVRIAVVMDEDAPPENLTTRTYSRLVYLPLMPSDQSEDATPDPGATAEPATPTEPVDTSGGER